MAEQLQQALVLYRKSHDHKHVLSDQDQKALEHSIARLTQDSLKQQTGMASFTHPSAFADVIRRTVETGKFQGERAASAFSTLERYVLLLLGQPWKREFRTLKVMTDSSPHTHTLPQPLYPSVLKLLFLFARKKTTARSVRFWG